MIPSHDISKRYAILGLMLILSLAAWMRLDGLGRFSFWTDEMYHVIAAQSMVESGEPIIPARGNYNRAWIATAMTAASFMIFGESEWSARFPFALVSLVFLLVVYWIVARRFTRLLALITVIFLALSPQFLHIGRECRMYAPFVLTYLIGIFLAFRAVEYPTGGARQSQKQVIAWLVLTAIVFAVAFSLQFLAVSFGFSLALYCLLMAGYVATKDGPSVAVQSRYAVLLGLMLLCMATAAVLLPATAARFFHLARTPEPWYTGGSPMTFCLWFFKYYYPALWFIYPLGAVILIRRYGRLGVFIVCAFLPVLLAHMFLFTARIAERYLVYILPFFFLTSACVVEVVIGLLVGWVRDLKSTGARATSAATALAVIPAMWLFLNPWLGLASELRRYGIGPDWKELAPELREACGTGIVIANWPREVMYYGGRFPDYFATVSYEYFGDDNHTVNIGAREVPVNYVLDARSLQRVLSEDRDIYFVTTDWAFGNDAFMSEAMRRLIREEMTEIASVASGNDRAVIYHARRHE